MGVVCCGKTNKGKRKEEDRISERKMKSLIEFTQAKFKKYNFLLKKQKKEDFYRTESSLLVDNIFHPNQSSLIKEEDMQKLAQLNTPTYSYEDKELFSNIIWERPEKIFKHDSFMLCDDGIKYDDILQGKLGDCYFLCALSALARNANRILKRILMETERSSEGVYTVKFYKQGKEKVIYIDDIFPCSKNDNAWVFCSTAQKEIWVQLLEKAWAKLNESYYSISSGTPYEALSALCNGPVYVNHHKNMTAEQLWDIFLLTERHNYIVCATSGENNDGEFRGILRNHGYSIIKVYAIGELKLLKIRNPWGGFEWKGDFSDHSPKWTPELKALTDFEKKEDGIFFMLVKDFIKYFIFTFICKYEEKYKYEFKKFEQKDKNTFNCVKVNFSEFFQDYTLPTSEDDETRYIHFRLHCKQTRFICKKIPDYKPQVACLIFFKKNKISGEITYLDSIFNSEENVILDIKERQSNSDKYKFDYYLTFNKYWPYEKKLTLGISSYACRKIVLEEVKPDELPKNYIINLLQSYLKEKSPEEVIVPPWNLAVKTNLQIFNNINFVVNSLKNNHKKAAIVKVKVEYNKEKLVFLQECKFKETEEMADGNKKYYIYEAKVNPSEEILLAFKMCYKRKHCMLNFEVSDYAVI